jgi:hypothetical protein
MDMTKEEEKKFVNDLTNELNDIDDGFKIFKIIFYIIITILGVVMASLFIWLL